jgi:hypothetical protein
VITLSNLSSAGLRGAIGASGSTGINGSIGSIGRQGASGSTGIHGASGLIGLIGSQGTSGVIGNSIVGASGLTGATGVFTGIIGSTGNTGATGATGRIGATGYSFFSGAQGATASQTAWLNDVISVTLKPNLDGASGATGSYASISPGIYNDIYLHNRCTLYDTTVLCSAGSAGLGTIYLQKNSYDGFPTGFSNVASISVTGGKAFGNTVVTCAVGDIIRVYTSGIASSGNVTVAIRYTNT